jgi:hypothetical protein
MVEISPIAVRRSRISAAAFTGRAAAPTSAGIDPQSQQLLSRNTLQLAVVSNQIQSLGAQVNQLSNSLAVVRNSLATSQALERQKERQEQVLENRLAQQKLREGKESAVEKKIQAKVLSPALKLGAKLQTSLGGLFGFFQRLFFGWLAIKGVETIQALADGNYEKLEQIKKSVLVGVGGFIALKLALKAATGGFRGRFNKLSLLLTGVAAIALFREPITEFFKTVGAFVDQLTNNKISEFTNAVRQGAASWVERNFPDPNIKDPDALPDPGETQKKFEEYGPPRIPPPIPRVDGGGDTQEVDPLTKFFNRTGLTRLVTPTQSPDPQVAPQPEPDILKQKIGGRGFTTFGDIIDPTLEAYKPFQIPPLPPYNPIKPSNDNSTEALPEGDKKIVPLKVIPYNRGQQEGSEEAKVGDKVTDPEILKMLEQEREIGRTGKIDPISSSRTVSQTISQASRPTVNVIPVPMNDGADVAQEAPAASGNIAASPGIIASHNHDNPYILGALAQYNVIA